MLSRPGCPTVITARTSKRCVYDARFVRHTDGLNLFSCGRVTGRCKRQCARLWMKSLLLMLRCVGVFPFLSSQPLIMTKGTRRRRQTTKYECHSGNGVSTGVRFCYQASVFIKHNSDQNIHAMRMGPGKHLKGLTLLGGVVKPEEVSPSY
jgi:hypothetical protein